MRYDKQHHQAVKQSAYQLIEQNKLPEFLALTNTETFTLTTVHKGIHESPNYADGGHGYDDMIYTPYEYTRDNKIAYLDNDINFRDFLNHALVHQAQDVIDYLLIELTKYNFSIAEYGYLWSSATPFYANTDSAKAYYNPEGTRQLLFSKDAYHAYACYTFFDEVFDQLQILESKIPLLKLDGHDVAAYWAYYLATHVQLEILKFPSTNNPNECKKNLLQFEENCNKFLQKAHNVLGKHRGYGKIFLNIGLAIAGVGILYLACAGAHYAWTRGKHFWFHYDTESAKIAKGVQSACNELQSKVKDYEKNRHDLLRVISSSDDVVSLVDQYCMYTRSQ